MATAQRTKNTVVLREGEATVSVQRPFPPLPSGMRTYWTSPEPGRKPFRIGREFQDVRVSYKLTQDQGMLEDLKQRAARNKSGSAQRGPASATANGIVTVDLSIVPALIRSAANLTGKKILEGPLVVTVKLLEPLEPMPLVCATCNQALEAHEHVTKIEQGAWVAVHGYDPGAERTEHYWLCA